MKFGKLTSPDELLEVDFSLPVTPVETQTVLKAHGDKPLRVHIGCPMWGNKAWIGSLYPETAKPANFLKHYSKAFNGIELNSTHYQLPKAEVVERWYGLVAENDNFRFSPKLSQYISHRCQLVNCEGSIAKFGDAIRGFGEKLGCTFVQLPPHFGQDKIANVRSFLEVWPDDLPLAIEFRDASWFEAGRLIEPARDLLAAHRVNALVTDVAGRRDVCHLDMTGTTLMLRFVGNGLVPTDYSRADAWIEKIAKLAKEGLEDAYLFMHEPDDTYAPDMGVYFIQQLNKRLGLNLHEPVLGEFPGAQMSLF